MEAIDRELADLSVENEELKAKVARLTARGIEDMQYEIRQLRQRIELLKIAARPVATAGLHVNTGDTEWIQWVLDLLDALESRDG